MFTSRAEYRLSLREDNADLRLTEIGRALGVVDDRRWEYFSRKRDAIAREAQRLQSTWVNPRFVAAEDLKRVFGRELEREYTAAELLRRPDVTYGALATLPGVASAAPVDPHVATQVEIQAKYRGYIERQAEEIERNEEYESTRLPRDLDYTRLRGLSIEAQQKLNEIRPETVGQAARISGITPAAISVLLVHARRGFGDFKKSA
jgi:tRNA uridine 5-carboxymethylaminomethyl modification enzyme